MFSKSPVITVCCRLATLGRASNPFNRFQSMNRSVISPDRYSSDLSRCWCSLLKDSNSNSSDDE